MKKISSSNFLKLIHLGGASNLISDTEISARVVVDKDLKSVGLVLRNCIFNENIIFSNIDLNYGIKFIDCKFNKALIIEGCESKKYDSTFNENGFHIELKNTKIETFIFSKNIIERGVNIYSKSKIDRLKVKYLDSKLGRFAINDSIIETQFDLTHVKSNNVEIRNNCIINSKVRFENISSDSIVITDSTFNSDVHMWAGKLRSLIFNDGHFKEDVKITAVPISGNLTIAGTEFSQSIEFKLEDKDNAKTGSIKNIYLSGGKFNNQFIVNGFSTVIDDLRFNFSQQLNGSLYFNSCNILKATLTGDNYEGNVVFNHCNFNNLNFDYFYNYSTCSLISTKSFGKDSIITIQHSNLGKTHFFNTFFDSFEKINIYNSILTDIISANVKWFDDKKLNLRAKETLPDYVQKKEIYRQLKFALRRQGNIISSLKFKALEMKSYKKELFDGVKWYSRIFNVNRFILLAGQTNDYGQNWFKPIIFAFSFGLIFYFLIVNGLSDKLSYAPNINCRSIVTTYEEYLNNISAFPQLMNPAHVLKRIFPNVSNVSVGIYFLDYFMKITIAFFIFQVVSAFRKYMK